MEFWYELNRQFDKFVVLGVILKITLYIDEEKRLLGISDNGFVSQYWYDASGERTVKASFDNEGVYINGALNCLNLPIAIGIAGF